MNYLDTSALIKRFVTEKGSELVQAIVIRETPVATAKIAYAEVYAGLARKHREGHLSATGYGLACRQFGIDWDADVRVDLRDEILFLARDLIQRHPLKGFDGIHLASALSLKNALDEENVLVAADNRLLRAARTEGLQTLNVERV